MMPDFIVFDLLLTETKDVPGLFMAVLLGVYAVITALFCIVIVLLIPVKTRRTRLELYVFIFCLSFMLPIVGIVAFFILGKWIVPIVLRKNSIDYAGFQYAPKLEGPAILNSNVGSIRKALHGPQSENTKYDIISSVRNLSDKQAVPILKLLVLDSQDDIRLRAYALLDQKDSKINEAIYELQQELKTVDEHDASKHYQINFYLAQNYWEQAYLGLAEDDLKVYAYNKSLVHAKRALKAHSTLKIQLLLSKLYITLNMLDEAVGSLLEADILGALPAQVYPYLADVAFQRRDIDMVKYYVAMIPSDTEYSQLQQMRLSWL